MLIYIEYVRVLGCGQMLATQQYGRRTGPSRSSIVDLVIEAVLDNSTSCIARECHKKPIENEYTSHSYLDSECYLETI